MQRSGRTSLKRRTCYRSTLAQVIETCAGRDRESKRAHSRQADPLRHRDARARTRCQNGCGERGAMYRPSPMDLPAGRGELAAHHQTRPAIARFVFQISKSGPRNRRPLATPTLRPIRSAANRQRPKRTRGISSSVGHAHPKFQPKGKDRFRFERCSRLNRGLAMRHPNENPAALLMAAGFRPLNVQRGALKGWGHRGNAPPSARVPLNVRPPVRQFALARRQDGSTAPAWPNVLLGKCPYRARRRLFQLPLSTWPNEVLYTAYIARPELCKSAGSC